MRKNRIVLLLLLLFLGGALFNACLREELEAPPEEPKSSEMEKMLKGIKNPNVREAIEWYCANGPGGASARGMVAEHPLFEQMVPSWSYAFVRFSKAGGMTVEVPLGAYARTMNTLPENAIAYEETKNSMYLRSVTRLVILKDKASGCTRGFFMTLVPSRKYMDKRNFNVYRSTYFQREREFDGDIYFHELDGRFSNGWRYSDGKITHSIHAGKSSSLSRSGGYWIEVTNCYPKYRYVCVGHYVPTESGSVYVEDHCYNEYVGEECYTEQVWVPGEDPGGEYDPKKSVLTVRTVVPGEKIVLVVRFARDLALRSLARDVERGIVQRSISIAIVKMTRARLLQTSCLTISVLPRFLEIVQ